jgi:hypothetical protein
MKTERYIVWVVPHSKKIQKNQFHTLASSIEEAIDNLNKHKGNVDYKIFGISIYDNLCLHNEKTPEESFINNIFI